MKEKVINLLIAIGASLAIVVVMALVTWLITFVCSVIGKWVLLLYVGLFGWLVWWIYNGLGSRDNKDEE